MPTWPALALSSLSAPELVPATLSDYRITAIDETTHPGAWHVVFTTPADRDAAATALTRQFPDAVVRAVDVPDEDWVTRSQAALTAVQIGGIIVAPPWDVPGTVPFGQCLVVIRPSMGFGTGHHATTRLCLSALQRVPVEGRAVIDVGTGSGLLAIAAGRLGAARVVAIDNDPDAIHAAEENLELNRGADITLRVDDLRAGIPGRFDLVLANLTAGLLRATASRLRDQTAPCGRVILSGFMRGDEADVVAAFEGFAVRNRMEEEEWLCVTLQRA